MKKILTKRAKKNILITTCVVIFLDIVFLIYEYFYGEITKEYIEHRIIIFLLTVAIATILNIIVRPEDNK